MSASLAILDTVDQALEMVERAHLALVAAVEFQETRQVRNLAIAATAFAREAKDGRLLARATELRARAERKAGQMLTASAARGERATPDKGGANTTVSLRDDTVAISQPLPKLADIGITRNQSSNWQAIGALSDDEFEHAVDTTKAVTQMVSTPNVMRSHKREQEFIESDAVAKLDAPRPVSLNEQAIAFYNAVRSLGEMTVGADLLRTALPSYQHFRILENVGPALALLQKVSTTWKT